VIVRPEAQADLASAWAWYEQQREGLGAAFLLAVEAVFERIERAPQLYPVAYQGVRRAFTRRFPYVVYFRFEDGEVFVLGILHTRRDPRTWQSRV
jgi:toxin ParE1/3/4